MPSNQIINTTLISLSRFISCFGDGAFFIGINWLVYNKSGSILFLSMFQAISGIPIILSIPFIGVIADRISRKKMVVFSDILRCIIIVLLIICIKFDYYTVPLFTANILLSVLEIIYFICYSGLVMDFIEKENLVSFNSTSTIAYQLGYLIGAATAGFIIDLFGNIGVLAVDSLSFLISAICILFVRKVMSEKTIENDRNKGKLNYFDNIVKGLAVMKNNKLLLSLVILSIPGVILIKIINLLEPAFISEVLNGTATSLGFADTSIGVGTIFGALIIKALSRVKKENTYLWLGYFMVSLGFIVFATVQSIPLAIIVNFFIGASYSGIGIIYNSNIQYHCDNEYIGRITSVKKLMQNAVSPLVLLAFGGIGSMLNYRYLFVILSLLILITALISYYIFDRKNKKNHMNYYT